MNTKQLPRGIRNNNPLNLRRTKSQWKGLVSNPTDKAFCQFVDIHYGIRAAFICLRSYIRKYRICQVKDIIYRWAPPTDGNNTALYISHVCKAMNCSPEHFVVFSYNEMSAMVRGMSFVENGGDYLKEEDIKRAWDAI